MTTETLQFDRFDTMLAEGRIIRRRWTGTDAQGRELACWLAALYPPVGEKQDALACPAFLMRPWLAQLVPWLDDAGRDAAWLDRTRRFGRVIRGLVALDDAADAQLSRTIRVLIVREAMTHVTVDEWGVRAACEQTIAALKSRAASEAAWAAAEAAAGDAARAAARAAAWAAARAAARDTAGAARAAAWAAGDAAWAAASEAAWDAEAAAGAARAAAEAAAEAAGERMIDAILAAFEQAVRAAKERT